MKRPEERERARTGLLALDLVEAAASAGTIESAADLAREMAPVVLEGLSVEEQSRVLAALAVMAVWQVPGRGISRESDGPRRLATVKNWVRETRLEWTWVAS